MGFDQLHPALQHHIVNSMGWRNLRPLQESAIDPLLAGEDAILLAPTAGGKTEAAIFPILSRMLADNWTGLSVLYVCPIKALLNNLHVRLEHLTGLIGRRVELWHGDVTESFRKKIRKDPPDVLLTTPESIESLLTSKKSIPREFFRDVRTVIVDEVHAFAGDDRGWHVLAVLSRLEEIGGRPIQRIGLSATVGNPDDLLVWISAKGRKGRVLNPPAEPLAKKAEVTLDYVGSLENAAQVISQLHRGLKRLVFCDARASVEELAAFLRERNVTTFVSHSSLALGERREAEQAFAEGRDCVIVATSTLELGIDVGDLDHVIQIDAPGKVSSFLQRIGRTGRRAGTSRNCLFLATSKEPLIRAAALIRLWMKGFVEPVEPPPEPLHILSQQLMALALQDRGVTREAWKKPLALFLEQTGLSVVDGQAILDMMLERDILIQDGELLWFGQTGERKFGRRHFTELLAVFMTEALLTVRHGRLEIGKVHPLSITAKSKETLLLLGGRSWSLLEVDWDRKIVSVEPVKGRGKARWMGDAAPLGIELCREYREVLVDESEDTWWSSRARHQMSEARDDYTFLASVSTTLTSSKKGEQIWWTFAGLVANVQITGWLEQRFGVTGKPDNFAIHLDRPLEIRNFVDELASMGDALAFEFTESQDLASRLKFNDALPGALLKRLLRARYAAADIVGETLRAPLRVVAMDPTD